MLEFSKYKSAFNGKYEYNIICDRCGKIIGTGHDRRNNIKTNDLCCSCSFEVFNSEKYQKYKRCMAMADYWNLGSQNAHRYAMQAERNGDLADKTRWENLCDKYIARERKWRELANHYKEKKQ